MIKLEIGAMKEYITIRNFGPLKDIEALEIKPFTFLIGESASGKSTLMKIIGMMRYVQNGEHSFLSSAFKNFKISFPIEVKFDDGTSGHGKDVFKE